MIRLPPASVRTRLAIGYVLSILAMVAVCTAAVAALLRYQALSSLDATLASDLAGFVDRYVLDPDAPVAGVAGATIAYAEAGQSDIDVWPVASASGAIEPGRRLRARGSGLPAEPPRVHGREGEAFDVVTPQGSYRALQATVPATATRSSLLLQASLSLAPIESLNADLFRYAGLVMLSLTVVATASGMFIAGAALAPINRIIDATRAIRPGALAARLPVEAPADEIAELSQVINGLLAQTQDALQRQARFATEAAHELRTPLTAQRNVGELALRGRSTAPEMREALSTMLEEGEHMQKLVESLLIVARADGGLLADRATRIDAGALADRCARSMLPLAEQRRQTLEVDIGESACVIADATLLRQSLLNLLDNAIWHSPEGAQINVRLEVAEGRALIQVIDNGPGFASFERDQIIRKHSRRRSDVAARGRGLGMGLAIVQALVRSQGGLMRVDSKLGLGTLVELSFEVAAPAPSSPGGANPVTAAGLAFADTQPPG